MERDIRLVLFCTCGFQEHQLTFEFDRDPKFPEAPYLIVSVFMSSGRRFWERLKIGLQYIFGKRGDYGVFDEIILDEQDVERLKKVLEEFPGEGENVLGASE